MGAGQTVFEQHYLGSPLSSLQPCLHELYNTARKCGVIRNADGLFPSLTVFYAPVGRPH